MNMYIEFFFYGKFDFGVIDVNDGDGDFFVNFVEVFNFDVEVVREFGDVY